MQRQHKDSLTILRICATGLLACGPAVVRQALAQELPNDDPTAVQYIFNKLAQSRATPTLTAAEFALDLGWCTVANSDNWTQGEETQCKQTYDKAMETLARARKTVGGDNICTNFPAPQLCIEQCGRVGVCPGLAPDAKLPSLLAAETWYTEYRANIDTDNQVAAEKDNAIAYEKAFPSMDRPGPPDNPGKPEGL